MGLDRKILITGATGFIGRHLVLALQEKGCCNISAIVRETSDTAFLKSRKINLICADISQEKSLEKISGQFDALFHCAGFVQDSNRAMLWKVNVQGTENACQLAMRLRVERLVYTSSVAVVSGNPAVPLVEDLPYSATNLYGESKIEAEKKALEYRAQGLKMAIIRPCMVYGPDEPHLMGLLLRLLRRRVLPMVNGGSSRLHMVYVKNVAEALIYAGENDKMLEGTFFIADNEALTIKELLAALCDGMGTGYPWAMPKFLSDIISHLPIIGNKLKFFLKDRLYSLERLKAAGFAPPYPARDSLKYSAKEFGIVPK